MYEIVLVDDEELILNGMASTIAWDELGYHLAGCYTDVQDVINAIESGASFDLILTDIRMDGLSGLDLARYIYEHQLPTKVIFLSGYREFEYARKGMEYNVSCYLTKPCSIETIKQTLMKLRSEMQNSYVSAHNADLVEKKIKKGSNALLERICDYIKKNCQRQLQLEEVAGLFYLHPSYLSRLFKKEVGVTFKEYLTRQRIFKANTLLEQVDLKVADVSEMVGYKDLHYFYDIYKRQMGQTPTEYREKLWADLRGKVETEHGNASRQE